VIQLADVFESFRYLCLDKKTGYELDPCHPMFWDAAIKKPEVKLALLTDLDMVICLRRE
jgi:hypothetical protein